MPGLRFRTEQGKPKAYRVILADPPWRYRQSSCQGSAEDQYPTMAIEEIAALPIGELADLDSVLLLWATWPHLEEAFKIIEAWGFSYVTGFPWLKIDGAPSYDFWGDLRIKPQYGIGYWVRGCTEPLLIGKRGNARPPPNGWVGLLSENVQHSRKPDDIYQYAESLPGPYLELFARRMREGWDSWGNEIEPTIGFLPSKS